MINGRMRVAGVVVGLAMLATAGGCGDDDDSSGGAGSAGIAGSAGSVNAGGSAGSTSTGGSAGSTGGGSAGSTSTGGSAGSTGSVTCAEAAVSYCDLIAGCSSYAFQFSFADKSDCAKQVANQCEQQATAPGSKTPIAKLTGCVANLTCEKLYNSEHQPEECVPLPGDKANGASCYADSQCQSTHCKVPELDGCGACVALGTEGAACDETSDCASDLNCAGAVCVKPTATAGQSCEKASCVAGLRCGQDDTCKAPGTKKAGEACASSDECDQTKGLYCGGSKTCTVVAFAALGEACGVVNNALVVCSGGNKCGDDSKCVSTLLEGAACTMQASGDPCGHGTRCRGGKCSFAAPTCQ